MLRLLVLPLFFFFSLSFTHSQEKINYANLKSLRQDGGFVQFQVEDFNPKKNNRYNNSLTYFWYKSQSVISTQGGSSGLLLHGIYEQFHANKQLAVRGFFKKGLKNGVWTYWNDEGKLIKEELWRKGKSKNSTFIYNTEGEIVKETDFGKDEVIYQLDKQTIISNIDSTQVKVVNQYPNGKKKSVAHFENGNLHGKQIEYDEKGNVLELKTYKHGELHGKQIIKDSIEQNYKNGELHGKQVLNDSTVIYYHKGVEKTPLLKRVLKKKERVKDEDPEENKNNENSDSEGGNDKEIKRYKKENIENTAQPAVEPKLKNTRRKRKKANTKEEDNTLK